MGQKWGRPHANPCHLMPNQQKTRDVKKALRPFIYGAVGLFCFSTLNLGPELGLGVFDLRRR
jgi:hypothetical protein